MNISTKYRGGMRFAHGEGPAQVTMDAKTEAGGRGEALSPKEMVLQGLAGCTGMDVVAMLGKKQVRFEDFSIEVEAEQTTQHPKVFKSIRLTYRITANPDDRATIERMIHLSKHNFCGVSAMLNKTAQISWKLDLTEKGSGTSS